MRCKTSYIAYKKTEELTGFMMENNGRISTLAFNFFKMNFDSIFYCLLVLGIIKDEDCVAIFKGKNTVAALAYLDS